MLHRLVGLRPAQAAWPYNMALAWQDFTQGSLPLAGKRGLVVFTRGSAGTYFDSSYVMQAAATNAARFDYDVSNSALGLLIEGARTNVALQSETFDNASWVKTRATISANDAVAPDGATTADKIVEDATAGATHKAEQSLSWASGVAYAHSLAVNPDTRIRLTLSFETTSFPPDSYGEFRASDGVFFNIGPGLDSTVATNWGNGWWRPSIVSTADATASSLLQLFLHNGSSISYNGDGASGLHMWGNQVEVGGFSSSYIGPTTTGSVLRNADTATISGAVPGAHSGIVRFRAPPAFTANAYVAQVGTGDDKTEVYVDTSGDVIVKVTSGGVVVSNLTAGAATILTEHEVAWSNDTGNFQAALDQTATAPDTGGAVPAAASTTYLGQSDGGDHLFGHLQKMAIFSRPVSDVAQLKTV